MQCLYENGSNTAFFPGIFYKDAVLSVISRSNSTCIITYNKFSYLKAQNILNTFHLKKSVIVAFEHYLLSENHVEIELGLSVFFEQSIVPYHEKERLDLIHTLMDFAINYPERRLVVCTRQYEINPHKPKVTLQEIISKYCLQLPENMQIVEEHQQIGYRKLNTLFRLLNVLLDAIYNDKQVSILKLKHFKHYEQEIF